MSLRTRTARNRIAGIAIAALVLHAAPGHARAPDVNLEPHTAGDLADMCDYDRNGPAGAARLNFCHGYTQGALTMELRREAATGKKRICIPNPAPTRSATLDEFVKWTRAIPKHQNQPVPDGFFEFLAERFPCK